MGEPKWITYDGGTGVPELTATELRQIEAANFRGPAGGQVYSGVRYGTGQVSLAGTTITHQALNFVIQGVTATTGAYVGYEPQATKVLQAAHATLARTDRVWVEVQDHEADASNQRRSLVVYAPGTAGGAAATVPTTAVLLAEINVPINNTAGAVVVDKRTYIDPPPAVFKTTSASGNFVKPTSPPAKYHIVEGWGPGSAGGGTSGSGGQAEGGGGCSGSYFRHVFTDAELAASEAYTVGQGGTGVAGAAGNPGSGPTTFKGLSAPAGTAGLPMVSGVTDSTANGGTGAVPTGGAHHAATGGDGGKGRRQGSFVMFGGFGAAAPNGGGTAVYPALTAGNGAPGKFPGGGGSGAFAAASSQSGGPGANGQLLITSVFQ